MTIEKQNKSMFTIYKTNQRYKKSQRNLGERHEDTNPML